ncbi:MAG: FKBP-type peptidyl-prolyl cis-trans isomerase [Bacteroidia bacterium]
MLIKQTSAFRTYFILLLAVTGFCTCKKKNAENQAATDDKIIKQYISDNKLNATATGDGLYYVIKTQGTGPQPTASSLVLVKYDGLLVNGTVFDQSPATGSSFSLSQVIKGWQEGLPYFKKGAIGTLLVPSALGYGQNATGNIPANSVLVFNLQLLDVK